MLSREDITALPKVELHNHLEGMIRLSTIIDLCKQFHYSVPGIENYDCEDIGPYLEHFCNYTQVECINVFFDKFWYIQSLLRTPEVIERISYECVEDSYNMGIRLLELRYSPSFICQSKLSDHSHLTMEIVLEAIVAGIARAKAKYDIAVGLIALMDRSVGADGETPVFNFIMDHKDDLVGIDLANDEAFSCKPFKDMFVAARAQGLGLTCHAGESTNAASVREAVEELDVTRIGHGIHSIDDSELIETLKSRNVTLEVCPMSNYLTGSVKEILQHPVRRLFDSGVKITISSDDGGVFHTSIVDDYLMIANNFGFTADEFRSMNINALEASFLPADVKESVRRKYFS